MQGKTTGKAILLYLLTPEDSSSSSRRGYSPESLRGGYSLLPGLKAVLWITVAVAVPLAVLHFV